MSLENLVYLFEQPFYLGLISLVGILSFLAKYGEIIYNWYQFKYQDFGTCRRCFGKQDNMYYLVCTKCYDRQMQNEVNHD